MKKQWVHTHSDDLYHISRWGSPYFSTNKEGDLVFSDPLQPESGISLMRIVKECEERGLNTPLLIRIDNILEHRLGRMRGAFHQAIDKVGYPGHYRPALPIKVNQQRHVIETLLRSDLDNPLTLEVGSKPELIVAIALLSSQSGPNKRLICNGYKDAEYLHLAAMASTAGIETTVVIDRFEEVQLFVDRQLENLPIPHIGLRVKLSARGAGKWEASSGDESKFGLTLTQLDDAVSRLDTLELVDHIRLIHYHIGSQITSISSIREAAREAFHIYAGLKAERIPKLATVDIGGGLAVDYDGSHGSNPLSRNYTLEEYAEEIIGISYEICENANVPPPHITTESGRALVAHHSVLVFDVLSADNSSPQLPVPPAHQNNPLLTDMWDLCSGLANSNLQSALNRARDIVAEARLAFSRGHLSLADLTQILRYREELDNKLYESAGDDDLNEDSEHRLLHRRRETYYCNFSLFQSLPDMWAVDQLFPIVPLHRHTEEPTVQARLVDLTCDSDGTISKFINAGEPMETLLLHPLNDERYYLGAFLVGAYQETLGDLHNLFGDTHVVHVHATGKDSYVVRSVVRGDRVDEVLSYVEYDAEDLVEYVRSALEEKAASEEISFTQARHMLSHYEDSLRAYTYLKG